MNGEQEQVLLKELEALRDDVPPMPADFHARWMQAVKEDAMEKKNETRGWKGQWKRLLATAAAVVFVVGGTLLTRDELDMRLKNAGSANSKATQSMEDVEYMEEAGYDMASPKSAPQGANNTMLFTSMARSAGSGDTAAATMDTGSEAAQESKIIRTASLTIATKTYEQSLAAIRAQCEESGGWISWSSENESTGGLRRANLTLRIPADKLDAFLADDFAGGRITNRSETMDDVTDSYYDTAARLETQKALMARLQSLVTDAADLSDVLALEAQMADTQYQIDRLTSSLQSTDKQVNYATVDVSLREEKASDDLTNQDMSLAQRLMSALEAGWGMFVDFLGDAVVFLVAALPFIAVVAVVGVIVVIVRKRKK